MVKVFLIGCLMARYLDKLIKIIRKEDRMSENKERPAIVIHTIPFRQ